MSTLPKLGALNQLSRSGFTEKKIEAIVLTTNDIVDERQQPLKVAIDGLRVDVDGLRADVRKLEEGFIDLKADFRDLKNDFRDLKSDFKDLRNEFKDLRTEFKDLRTDFEGLKEGISTEIEKQINSGLKNLELRLLKWVVGSIFGAVAVTLIVQYLIRAFG